MDISLGAGVARAALSVAQTTGPFAAPISFTVAPSVLPASGAVGTSFTLNYGAATGSPSLKLVGTLRFDGEDVTAQISANTFSPDRAGQLEWTVSASDGAGAAVELIREATVSD